MVVGDLGLVEMADAHVRLHKKLRPSDDEIPVCTANYRPPDVTLGSQRFQEELFNSFVDVDDVAPASTKVHQKTVSPLT